MSALPPEMRRFLRRGLLLYPVAGVGLWVLSDLGGLNAFFLAALLELLPVLAVAQLPLAASEEIDRPAVYGASAGTVLFLGWTSLVLGRRSVGLAVMGLGPLHWEAFLLWSGAGAVAGLALEGAFWVGEKLLEVEESAVLREILPRTATEKALFAGVSLTAGLGEELAYRGYAIPLLAGLVGSAWGAAVLSSGIFGFLHAYQGEAGVARAALMGLALAGIFLASGSLWPAMVAHVVIDLFGGLVLGPRLLADGSGTGK